MNTTLTIATRESPLALKQANLIKTLLEQHHPKLNVVLLGITTQGDKIQDRPLADVGGKGLFLKELQQAVLSGAADIAVHSAKDVPVEDIPGLQYLAFCQQQDARDVLLSRDNIKFSDLPKNAIVGTSSFRRKAQLLSHRPDLQIKDLRGNVDTRIKKLALGDYDAIVLAAAGLIRLGLQKHITEYFPTDFMLPAVGQGALIIEGRANDRKVMTIVKCLHEPKIATCLQAARMFTSGLQGDCHSPIGVYAFLNSGKITLEGVVLSHNGQKKIRLKKTSSLHCAEQLGKELAEHMILLGADELLRGTVVINEKNI